jgi:hypothetical protein
MHGRRGGSGRGTTEAYGRSACLDEMDRSTNRCPCVSQRTLGRRLFRREHFGRSIGIALLTCLCANSVSPVSRATKLVLDWNAASLQGIRDAKMAAPMAARALAIVNTCMYDAWAAYDERAVGTQLGGVLRRPLGERTVANKERAISYATYRALSDVLPVDTESVYKPLMKELGYDPNDASTDIETPTGIGNVACAAVLPTVSL